MNGTSTNPIYIGVDQSWYAGNSWTRPALNGDNPLSTSPVSGCRYQTGGGNVFFHNQGAWTVLDNIEFLGLCWSTNPTPFLNSVYILGCAGHCGYTNLYVHGWTHTAGSDDSALAFGGDTAMPSPDIGSYVANSVFDGADSDRNSFQISYGSPPEWRYNVIRNVGSGLVSGISTVHDNLWENIGPSFDGGKHTNVIECGSSCTSTVYNNIIRHIPSAQTAVLFLGPGLGGTDYVYNNVIYDVPDSNVVNFDSNGKTPQTSSIVVFNNTVALNSGYCFNVGRPGGPAFAGATIRNNHCITNLANGDINNITGTNITSSNELVQPVATAAAQGFSASTSYAPAAGSATIGTGMTLSSSCSGAMTDLCRDTTLGVSYDAARHVVIVPARASNARSSSWDRGAYEYGGSSSGGTTPPNPPTSLTATSH